MFTNEIVAVTDFQERFDTPLCELGTPIKDVPSAVMELNKRINLEELTETLEKGVKARNLVELADGCGDTIYTLAHAINQLGRIPNVGLDSAAAVLLHEAMSRVSLVLTSGSSFVSEDDIDRNLSYAEIVIRGIAATYGIPLDEVFDEIHKSNMSKVFPDGKGRKDEGGKVQKPEGYSKPNIQAILASTMGTLVRG